MKLLLILFTPVITTFTLIAPAYSQVQYQYVPNSPPWPTVERKDEVPTTRCVLVNSYQNNGQQYPSASYQVCN
jgi:hypothetical protein